MLIHTLVSEEGLPTDLHVVQPLGYGLNEKAIEAVGRYRFSPAILGGVPVPMTLDVRVDYTIIRYRK